MTLGLFGLRGAQAEYGPSAFAALAECCVPFEPGQRYQEFVRALRPEAPPPPPPAFSFQEFVPSVNRWVTGAGSWERALESRCQAVGTAGWVLEVRERKALVEFSTPGSRGS